MSTCTITDQYGYLAADGTFVPLPGQQIFAVPDSNERRFDFSGTYRLLAPNPDIRSEAYRFGTVATTDAGGEYTFVLQDASTSTHETSPLAKWNIILPDGRIVTGEIPAVAGPITVDDLIESHDWVITSHAEVLAPTSGVEAFGVETFSGQDSKTVTFAGSGMANNGYTIELTASADTGTGELVQVAYDESSVSTSGFDIVMADVFTGTVRWRVKL